MELVEPVPRDGGPEKPMHYENPIARDYLSDHSASSFPLGSVKWKRRPPGNEKIGLTILPPAERTFCSLASRLSL